MVDFGFITGLMDGFRFYGFVWFAGVGLWVWVCRHEFVVDRWWLCAVCGGLWCGFVGMVVVGLRWTNFDIGFGVDRF